MNVIFQRGAELTAVIVYQLREFLITLFHLETPSWARKSEPRSLIATSYGALDQYEGNWGQDEYTGDEGFLDEHEDTFCICDEDQCYWMRNPFPGRYLKKGGKSKGKRKKGKSKAGKGSAARRIFGFSGNQEARARSLERQTVHLLARQIWPGRRRSRRRRSRG